MFRKRRKIQQRIPVSSSFRGRKRTRDYLSQTEWTTILDEDDIWH